MKVNKDKPTLFFPRDPAALERFLAEQGVNLDQWGIGGAKTTANLWKEIQTGDSRLQHRPLRRLVEAAMIIVQRDKKLLIEVAQTLQGGRTRTRYWPPSEKLQRGETARQAALRCLIEELDLTPTQFTLSENEPLIGIEERESASYPGLITIYRFFLYKATIPGLPVQPFQTRERSNDGSDPVKTHSWEWGAAPQQVERILNSGGEES